MATDISSLSTLSQAIQRPKVQTRLKAIPARLLKKPVAAFMPEIAKNLELSVLVVFMAAAK